MSLLFLALALVSIQATVGEPYVCRIRGDMTNGVKCGDKVYKRSQGVLDVLGDCSYGRKGQAINMETIRCILASYRAVDGSLPLQEAMRDICRDFGSHAEEIYQEAMKCYEVFKDEPSESTKLVECWSEMSVRVCGIKTCNWLNNLV